MLTPGELERLRNRLLLVQMAYGCLRRSELVGRGLEAVFGSRTGLVALASRCDS